jgi:hypothetical protein
MIARRLELAAGEHLKLNAQALLEAHREAVILRARGALLVALLAGGQATIDDVREVVHVPAGIDPKVFGAVPGPLARAGIIRCVGSCKTARRTAHARDVKVWELRDRTAALGWLATHPDLSDDEGAAGVALPFPSSPQNPDAAAATARPEWSPDRDTHSTQAH